MILCDSLVADLHPILDREAVSCFIFGMASPNMIQQFSDDVNAAYPLHQHVDVDDQAWDVVQGPVVKSYFDRSPYATIDAHTKGFIVHNLVVGSQHPCATYNQAAGLRSEIAGRYQTISAGPRQW